VYDRLEQQGIRFRAGQVSMVAAAPGAGKSVFAQWLAIRAGVPALYFSADSDQQTMTLRAAAMLTGDDQAQIEKALDSEQGTAFYESELDALDFLRFVWDPGPSAKDIEDEIAAFAMMYGQYPRIIVFDNAMNFQQGAGEWEALLEFLLNVKSWAANTNAHVMVLHHVGGSFTDNPNPPPRSGIHGKVDQLPELILTIGRNVDEWKVAIVKSRNSKAKPDASLAVAYHVDFPTMQVADVATHVDTYWKELD
jgi:RecA-family ATPase